MAEPGDMPLIPPIRPQAIDLFTDTAAILKLLDLRSIMGCPGALAQYLHALFGQKENFNVFFSGKRRSLLHPNRAEPSLVFHYYLFLGKRKEKLARKARVNSERVSRILLMPPWASHNSLNVINSIWSPYR